MAASHSNQASPRRLIDNIGALYVLQGVNYLLPLIIIPYLVRTLGPERFGAVAFAQAFIQYFVILSDYGFAYSATKEISVVRDNPEEVGKIVSAVLVVKAALTSAGFGILACTMFAVPLFRADWPLYLICYLAVIGHAMFPGWYFQGVERLRYAAVFTTIARVLMVLFILLLVRRPTDYLLAAAVQSSTLIVAAIMAFPTIRNRFEVRFSWPSRQRMWHTLRAGHDIFISTAAVTLYANTNAFVLGLITNNTVVGYYTGAEKIIRAAQGLTTPVSQAIYPRVSYLMTHSRAAAFLFLRRTLLWLGLGALALSSILFIYSESAVRYVLGPNFQPAIPVVQWMAFIPLAVTLSNIFGVQTMLTAGLTRQFRRTLLASGVLNLLLIVPLARGFGANGAAASLLITECVVTLAMAFILYRCGIRYWIPRGNME